MALITYEADKDGQIFRRKSHRTYEYLIVGRGVSWGRADNRRWSALSWARDLYLANKKISQFRKSWKELEIIPVRVIS